MYAGRGSTDSKATGNAERTDGFATIIEPDWERESPTLCPPHASNRDEGPGPTRKAWALRNRPQAAFFAAAELTGDRLA